MPTSPPHRWLEIEDLGNVTVVRFLPRKVLDEQEIRAIGEQLFSLPELGRVLLALDFSNVDYVASALTGKLITLQRKVKAAGGRLVLCQLNPNLADLFRRSGLSKMFDIQGTVAEGLLRFEPGK